MGNYCANFPVFIVGQDDRTTKIIRGRCKKWACEYCSKINALVWVYRIRDTIDDQTSWSFVTFTSPSKINNINVSTEFSLVIMQKSWRKFREALRYKRGDTFKYLRVYELQDNGRYHIHAIIEHRFDDIKTANRGKDNQYTYSRWQKDNLRKWGFGTMCNAQNFERRGSDWRVAKYIGKYLTKGDDRIGDGVRRFQASHGFAKSRESSNDIEWKIQHDINQYDLYYYNQSSDMVIDITAGNVVTFDEVTPYQTYREWIEKNERNKPSD